MVSPVWPQGPGAAALDFCAAARRVTSPTLIRSARPKAVPDIGKPAGRPQNGRLASWDTNELTEGEEIRREDVAYGPLQGYLGHLLRRATGRVLGDFAETMGEEISPAEFGLLTLIVANPGITQVRLAAALGLDKSTLSPALARLTKRGLVRRERLASDGRLQALHLMPGAEGRYAALHARVAAHEKRVGAILSPRDHAELIRLLRIVVGYPVDDPPAQEFPARVDGAAPPP